METVGWNNEVVAGVRHNYRMEDKGMMRTDLIPESGNSVKVTKGIFGGTPVTQADEINRLSQSIKTGKTLMMTPGGVIKSKDDVDVKPEDGNCSEVKPGTFAAGNSDQWYKRNPVIFRAEIQNMKKNYPDAEYGFMESTGDMYWIVKLNMTESGAIPPVHVMLMYDKNHPSNTNYGGSVKCILLDPNVSELREMARKKGRRSVPHLLGSENSFVYLCTRLPQEISSGKSNMTAVQAASFAADWYCAFFLGLQDKDIWNYKFCGNAHRDCWVA